MRVRLVTRGDCSRDGFSATCANVGATGLGLLATRSGNNDLGAFLGEEAAPRLAHALRSARDDRDLCPRGAWSPPR